MDWQRAHQVCQVSQDLGGLAGGILVEVKQLWVVINERCGCLAREELRVAQHVLQEQDVGFYTPDLKLDQGSLHLLHRMHIAVGPHNDLQGHIHTLTDHKKP